MARAITTAQVRTSLLGQLKAHGADIELMQSMVDDYCWLHQQVQEMKKDIKKRGRTYIAVSSTGKEYDKDNPSVTNILKYNTQMTRILQTLKLDAESVLPEGGEDVEEDL
jgi:phage terminase small subunit